MRSFLHITIAAIALLLTSTTMAQTVALITTCGGAVKNYWVTPEPNVSYTWWATGGVAQMNSDPLRTDSISVTWENTVGTDTLFVIGINEYGCPGDTIKLIINRLSLMPTATITGRDTLCYGDQASIAFAFTGAGPWQLTLQNSNAAIPDTVLLFNKAQDTLLVNLLAPPTYQTYHLANVSDTTTKCQAAASGLAEFWISSEVKTSPIFHD